MKKQHTKSAVSRSGVANKGVLNPSLATPDSGFLTPALESGALMLRSLTQHKKHPKP